jgi:hypothetical protein
MASQVGLTLVKRFTYRGDSTEEFSNTYHLTGGIPADDTAWKALADALIVSEKACYTSQAAVVRAYGYDSDADDAHAVYVHDYLAAAASVPGTLALGAGAYTAGDQAAWVRWKTSRLNTKGKPIFLRKYFHSIVTGGTGIGGADTTSASWQTAANALATKLTDGTFLDSRLITARGHTDVITSHAVSLYTTTRTLKRRGKRPGS